MRPLAGMRVIAVEQYGAAPYGTMFLAELGARHDVLRREHHQMCVVDRHERREEQLLGVLEVFVEYAGDVLGREPHERSIARNYLK